MAEKKINPEEYASDHRVAYLVDEWKRLTQAEKDAEELVEADPSMRELADKELKDIGEAKERMMAQIETIVGSPNEREWPNELILEVRAGVGGDAATLFAEDIG